MTSTIVALFDDYNEAQSAIRELESAGVRSSDISLIANNAGNRYGTYPAHPVDRVTDRAEESKAVPGAAIGAALGGGVGLLTGLGLMAIPGVGPVVAAGALVATLAGAAVGAAAGGLVGALVKMGVPREHADIYAEAVRRGGTLVAVRTEDGWHDRVTDILDRHSPVDIEERAGDWRREGWSGFDERAEPYSGPFDRTPSLPPTPPVDRPMATGTVRETSTAAGSTPVGTADADWKVRRDPDRQSDAGRPVRVRIYPEAEVGERISEKH